MTVKELREALACMRDDADIYFDGLTQPVGWDTPVSVDGFEAKNPGANNYQIILYHGRE
jgi:hypothetical protein